VKILNTLPGWFTLILALCCGGVIGVVVGVGRVGVIQASYNKLQYKKIIHFIITSCAC